MNPDDEDHDDAIRLLRDSVDAFLPATGGLARVRGLRFSTPGFDRTVVAQMAELGWIGILVPEASGGMGLGLREFCALCEKLGAGLVPEPYIQLATTAAILSSTENRELLADLIAGRRILIAAWQESPDTLNVPGTAGTQRIFVPMAAGADACLVPVRNSTKCSLLRVPVSGSILNVAFTQDGGHYVALSSSAAAGAVGKVDVADIERALDAAALGTAAYLLGVAEAAFAMTLDYLKSRIQFGKPLGSFQVLQHRATDLKMQLELIRASIGSAADALDGNPNSAERAGAVSRAKARASDAALLITREAIQLHGAIGYTDECDVGLYLRKALVLSGQYGSSRYHRKRFMSAAAIGGNLVSA